MTTITFWAGLNTIGGNIVEIATEQVRLFTDFGTTMGVKDHTLRPLNNAYEEQILHHALPPIPGVFKGSKPEVIALERFEQKDDRPIIVFISHLHLDHVGALPFITPEAQIYALEETVDLYNTLVKEGLEVSYGASFIPVQSGETKQFGDLKVTMHVSDHDTIGAGAIFVEAPDVRVIHSGDLRLTGHHPERVAEWAKKAREFEPDFFLIEGTMYSFDLDPTRVGIKTEEELREVMRKELAEANDKHQMMFINTYPRNPERLKLFQEVTSEQGRTLVLPASYRNVLKAFFPLSAEKTVVTSEEQIQLMHQEPEKYTWLVRFQTDDIAGFEPGTPYVHSNGEPLGAYDPRYQVLVDELESKQYRWVSGGVSGHGLPEELLQVLEWAQPKMVIPWHSFRPEVMQASFEQAGYRVARPVAQMPYHAKAWLDYLESDRTRG
ncbi:MBL fold metallo-hydrolase [Atopobacter phocae]|uniref:MBL fold metallo-hydrolase n=1 Tax=Atopobacter phocae TaxID=136492 RepID=UPI00046F7439|nr:MBL fold metallo-hydrolase [Atopobacter phocae]